MIELGIGLPGRSVSDVRAAAAAAAAYNFASFSVYGDLGDLPPYAVLHSSADILARSAVKLVGPMGVLVGMQHPEVVAMHAVALNEQLPGQSYVGLVRGAFLEQINEKPATTNRLDMTVQAIREKDPSLPIYLGGFGEKTLRLAGQLGVAGLKLGGSSNISLADRAQAIIANPDVAIVLGAVSVIDKDGRAARALARQEVAKYIDVVGRFDPTLNEDEQASLDLFCARYPFDPQARDSISDALLDKFAIAGTPQQVTERLRLMDGRITRFELGTPHGLGDRSTAIKYIGDNVLKQLGD